MSKIILFSTFNKTDYHKSILIALFKMSISKGYRIHLVKNNKSDLIDELDNNVEYLKDISLIKKDTYVSMVAFGKEGYRQIKQFRSPNVPFLYLLCSGDIKTDYLYNHLLYDRMILIADKKTYQSNFFPVEFSDFMPRPFLLKRPALIALPEMIEILVSTDENTLLKILPVLNNHGEYNFTVLCNHILPFKNMINSNIILLTGKQNEEEYIRKAFFVIGSGDFILRSILLGKPSIVIGQHGFGRMVNKDNIEQHYQTNFQGRFGSNNEEIIPFHLLSQEITDIILNIKLKYNEARLLYEDLERMQNDFFSVFERNLSYKTLHKRTLKSQYKLGSQYWFVAIDAKEYYLVDNRFMKVYAQITIDEYAVLSLFEEISTIESALEKNKNINSAKYERIIDHLIKKRILFYYGEANV